MSFTCQTFEYCDISLACCTSQICQSKYCPIRTLYSEISFQYSNLVCKQTIVCVLQPQRAAELEPKQTERPSWIYRRNGVFTGNFFWYLPEYSTKMSIAQLLQAAEFIERRERGKNDRILVIKEGFWSRLPRWHLVKIQADMWISRPIHIFRFFRSRTWIRHHVTNARRFEEEG